jgi:hypothetical protein
MFPCSFAVATNNKRGYQKNICEHIRCSLRWRSLFWTRITGASELFFGRACINFGIDRARQPSGQLSIGLFVAHPEDEFSEEYSGRSILRLGQCLFYPLRFC